MATTRSRYSAILLAAQALGIVGPVSGAGSLRLLRVLVETKRADRDLIGSIGHELQHAVEVLEHRNLQNDAAVYLFYARVSSRVAGRLETEAAVQAGQRVRAQMKQNADR
jgi:hypothetical protein